jgi:mevalonate kinase
VTVVAVSAPGKLILLGEHAVVYGRPALTAAIDRRLAAHLSTVEGGRVFLDLPGLRHAETLTWNEVRDYTAAARRRWADYAQCPGPETFQALRGADPAHVVKIALGETLGAFGSEPSHGLGLRVASELPPGSGLGSSAATAVAVIAGAMGWLGLPADLAEVERLALEVERRQHGHPSGADGATVLRGGVLWVRRQASGELAVEAVRVRSSLLSRFRVYETGTPAEPTGAVVAAVRQRREADPVRFEGVLDRIEAATASLRTELEREDEDRDRALHLIREAQACLEELGVVPEAVRSAVREIEAAGGAAKVSGAGSLAGPGAGSLLVYHPEPGKLFGLPALRPFPDYAVHLGAPGFRQERAG